MKIKATVTLAFGLAIPFAVPLLAQPQVASAGSQNQVQRECPAGSTGVGRPSGFQPGSIVPGQSRSEAAPSRAGLACITFENAQWAMFNRTADAATRIAAAAATQSDTLGELERSRRDLNLEISEAEVERDAASAIEDDSARRSMTERLNTQIQTLMAERDRVTDQIETEFPRYASVVVPKAISIPEVRAHLRPKEALVQILVNADAAYVWVVTREQIAWRRVPSLNRNALNEKVASLREMLAKPEIDFIAASGTVRFDGQLAYGLYNDLFGSLESILPEGTTMFVVADGALAALPLGVLLVADPGDPIEKPLNNPEYLREAKWLADRNPIAMLPTVGAFQSLRCFNPDTNPSSRPAACPRLAPTAIANLQRLPRAEGALDFFGVGDPELLGTDAGRSTARPPPSTAAALGVVGMKSATSGGLQAQLKTQQPDESAKQAPVLLPRVASLDVLRRMQRLRGSGEELREILSILNGTGSIRAKVLLGSEATEPAVRGPDERGALAMRDALYVSFATHGLLNGEAALGAAGLVLTPPQGEIGTEKDDGLLSAPEIALLRIRARLVVLSACNTADAVGRPSADGLPGLTSAFFLAGARSVMVSHWPVSDEATARLMTDVFKRMDAAGDAPNARLNALRAAMKELRDTGAKTEALAPGAWAHPAYWGPFSFVGDPG